MLNNLEKIEEIMRPYYEKEAENKAVYDIQNELNEYKEQIEKENSSVLESYSLEKNILIRRLENLQEKKQKEINEYIEKSINSRTFLYAGYVESMRKDLEKAYSEQEENLENRISEIKKFEKELKDEIQEKLNTKEIELNEKVSEREKYKRVYIREMVDIKEKTRKLLIQEYKKQQEEFKRIIDEIKKYDYKYDEKGQVINGMQVRELFDKSSELAKSIGEIRKSLNLMELNQEEINNLMMSLTHWEQAEYNRRKGLIEEIVINPEEVTLSSKIESKQDSLPSENEPEEVTLSSKIEPTISVEQGEVKSLSSAIEENNESEDKIDDKEDLIETIDKALDKEQEKLINEISQSNDENSNVSDEYDSLIENIREDVISEIEGSKAHEINMDDSYPLNEQESIVLPSGIYVNFNDLKQAMKNYKNSLKGRTLKVKEKAFEVTNSTIKKLQRALKKCSKIRKETKDGYSRIYAQAKKEDYINSNTNTYEVELTDDNSKISSSAPDGDYVNKYEMLEKIDLLFKEKKINWLKNISNKISETINKRENEKLYEVLDEMDKPKTK